MAMSTRLTTTTVRTASPSVVSQLQKSDDDLLTDLFTAYYDARKNKRNTFSQVKFEQNLAENMVSLWNDIRLRTYRPGRCMCFIIRDPVQREVFASSFRDRIVHHLLFNYLNPLIDPLLVEDCYSCRKGKGTHFGVKRMMFHMQSCLEENPLERGYILKLDIEGYFMTIDRSILYDRTMSLLEEAASGRVDTRLPDSCSDVIEYLLKKTIFHDPTRGCRIKGSRSDWKGLPASKSLFHSSPGCGLPIGNLTSQLFSNVYLSALDRYVTSDHEYESSGLEFKHYGRYVDDFYVISSDKGRLLDAVPKIRSFLKSELRLSLHPRKLYLQEVGKGVRFLGYHVTPGRAVLHYTSRKRLSRHILESWTEEPDPFVSHSVRLSCLDVPVWK